MSESTARKKIACLLADGFEDSEFRIPYDRLKNTGYDVEIIGAQADQELTGYKKREVVTTGFAIDDVDPKSFAGLLIPGGQSPDHLRVDQRFVDFVKEFDATGRPLAAVCHGPQLLLSAELQRGRTLTAWPTVQGDLRQAGANVKDEPVVVDRNWITSRNPDDLDAFSGKFIEALAHGEAATNRDSARVSAR
ncbi:MAG TPA: type 1 glutamine amidotransferase domain-containing protein [Polyangiaceae bacterium]|nr:type 1 glutamine amidotransferase domain-containing protein [Polyangiaceae bacterium]